MAPEVSGPFYNMMEPHWMYMGRIVDAIIK